MTCGVCGTAPSTPCGGCSQVEYCGKDCQRKDWRQHKANCKSYKVVTSVEEHGNHAVACRDLKKGEKIMCVEPDLLGPRLMEPIPCCLGCHRTAKKLNCCPKCTLPVCSPKCTTSPHHQLECALIAKSRASSNDDSQMPLEIVLPLRILGLKYTKPNLYERILSMETNFQEIRKTSKWSYYVEHVIEPLMGLNLEEVTRDLVESILGIILSNTFEVVSQQCILVGIYLDPSSMNHDCIGNTRVSMDGGGKMTVMAAVHIKKNTPIKFNYIKGLDTLWTRQVQLKENKFFNCACARCLDPTELGSYASAHSCQEGGCQGNVIPVNPLCPTEDWKCEKCGRTVAANQIRKTLKAVDNDLEKVDRNNMKDLKKILNKYKQKLYKNHGILTEIKQMIASGYGRLPDYQMEDMREADHQYKILLCQEILAVQDIVEPGLTIGRGLILFELHSCLVMVANIEFEKKQNPNQLLVRLLEAERILTEADSILKCEPMSSPYGHLASTIQRNRQDLAEYIENVKMM